VIEFDGKSWQEFLEYERKELAALEEKAKAGKVSQKELASAKKTYDMKETTGSRLFVVDVGNDPNELRSRYPERRRHIIMPASVRLHLVPSQSAAAKGKGARLQGYVEQILVSHLYVPRKLHPPVESAMKHRQGSPYLAQPYGSSMEEKASYTLTLLYGKRYEPWIADIKPAPAAKGK